MSAPSLLLPLLFALLSLPVPVRPEDYDGPKGLFEALELKTELEAREGLDFLLRAQGRDSLLLFAAEARPVSDEAATTSLRAGLLLPGLIAGPVETLGAASFIDRPASWDSLLWNIEGEEGRPLRLDSALETREIGLAVGRRGLWAFGETRLDEGRGSGFVSGGLAALIEGLGGAQALVATVGRRLPRPAGVAWKEEGPAELPGATLSLGLVRSARTRTGRTALALAASWGELDGSGLALRMEAEALLGEAWLSLSCGAASPSYRGRGAASPSRGLGGALDFRLPLSPRLALELACRAGLEDLERPRPGTVLPAIPLSLRLGLDGRGRAEGQGRLGFGLGRDDGERVFFEPVFQWQGESGPVLATLLLDWRRRPGSEAAAREDRLSLDIDICPRPALSAGCVRGWLKPSLGLALEWSLLAGTAASEAPAPTASASLGLGLLLPKGGSLVIELGLKEGALAVLGPEEKGAPPELHLSYGRRLEPGRGRP